MLQLNFTGTYKELKFLVRDQPPWRKRPLVPFILTGVRRPLPKVKLKFLFAEFLFQLTGNQIVTQI